MSLRYAPQGSIYWPLQGTSELAHKGRQRCFTEEELWATARSLLPFRWEVA
jgi:hypothetical protein